MNELIIGLLALVSTAVGPMASAMPKEKVVAEHQMSLADRVPGESYANEVFSDNILLALHYFKGDADSLKKDKNGMGPDNIYWEKVRQPFEFAIELKPDEVFTFHGNLLKDFQGSKVRVSGSKYNFEDGYKELGGLYGNGVCHLASLINWVASTARLDKADPLSVTAKVNHDFSPVPDVPREYGTAILYMPGDSGSQAQNLYIKNTSSEAVKFIISASKDKVDIKASI